MKTKNIHDIQLHWFILIDTVNHSRIMIAAIKNKRLEKHLNLFKKLCRYLIKLIARKVG